MYRWVSARAERGHGTGRRGDFLNPDTLAVLADPKRAKQPESPQKRLFNLVRTPRMHRPTAGKKIHGGLLDPEGQEAINQANLYYMPPLAGDEGDVAAGRPTPWLTLTETQYAKLSRWKEGDFINDLAAGTPAAMPFESLPVERRPAALTRAALEACQGGAFFPGIEITSIVRFRSFYSEAFRVSDDYGAGDVTRWMALPWQADFYECRGHWWPSVRPDDVMPQDEFESIVASLGEEVARGRIGTLLDVRKPWDRGVGRDLPPRPRLPDPVPGASPADYRLQAARALERLGGIFLRSFQFGLAPDEFESAEAYRRRAEEFLAATIFPAGGFDLPPLGTATGGGAPRPQTAQEFFDGLRPLLATGLGAALAVPAPNPDESLEAYRDRLEDHASGDVTWQGLFDFVWRNRDAHRGKNDLVDKWWRLGFVAPATAGGEVVYIERDRKKYDLLQFRDYFHLLMNIESNPDFRDTARELAYDYLEQGKQAGESFVGNPLREQYTYFKFDADVFAARLEKIYNTERAAGERYTPTSPIEEPLFRTPEHVVERIRQLAPFNQLDGSWLERATKAGPINEVNGFLFEIWADEVGNGDPAQSHANVYVDLMHSANVYLPPLNSRAYADHPDLWDASFSSPAYQSALAYFPETFYPEILGMTLYLEWEAIFLPAMVKLYEYHGYPSLFYRLHVAIDNPVNGHGARARDAVLMFLDHVRAEGGDGDVQDAFKRIWTGYLAFRFGGFDEFQYRLTNPPTLYDRMLAMVESKRRYGRLNHGVRRLGPNRINDLFDEPDQFLAELAGSDLIVKGDARQSPIFGLMGPTGPMLKVFTAKERDLWADWINALPKDPVGAALPPGRTMEVLLRQFTPRGIAVPEHAGFTLKGEFRDPAAGEALAKVEKSVSWWFQIGQPDRFMAALADTCNGWVVPGNPDGSRLVAELLVAPGRMSRFLARPIAELGGKPARNVIIDWIAAGCPQPEQAPERVSPSSLSVRQAMGATPPRPAPPSAPENAADVVRRSSAARTFSAEQRRGLRTRYYGPGGGAAH
jgi:hypothetical protein